MQTLAEIMDKNQHTHQREQPSTTNTLPMLSARSKAELSILLGQICALQKQYGKKPEELEVLVEGFSVVLADFSIGKIKAALFEYIKKNSDIPAPADIIKIIEEQSKPKFPEVPLSQLLEYRRKGIPLSSKQLERLEAADKPIFTQPLSYKG